jgi:hypothetical protein
MSESGDQVSRNAAENDEGVASAVPMRMSIEKLAAGPSSANCGVAEISPGDLLQRQDRTEPLNPVRRIRPVSSDLRGGTARRSRACAGHSTSARSAPWCPAL